MKTHLPITAKILISCAALLFNAFETKAQQTASIETFHSPIVEELTKEVFQISQRATNLRKLAAQNEGEIKELMLKESASLEKESMMRQIRIYELNYSYYLSVIKDNKRIISVLEQSPGANENAKQTEYLLDECNRNVKLATELVEESQSQENLTFKLGSLDNADEKMSLAIIQQEKAITLLKKSYQKVVKAK